MGALIIDRFPKLDRTVRARWAPILLSPILGSPERLVVAVAAANESGFHIEPANAMHRLECLFGAAANTAIFSAEVALDELRFAFSSREIKALNEGMLVFSSVSVGTVSEGEADSLQELAKTWMNALSSLYRADTVSEQEVAIMADDHAQGTADRLPVLVLEDVRSRRPGLEQFFSDEIRRQQRRRSRSVTKVSIDFAGSHLVANFGTLQTGNRASSVDRIKRKLFDLIVRRDEEGNGLSQRPHEMIVFSPGRDSPLASERQLEILSEALNELGDQSKREGVGFLPVHSVSTIGDHILEVEEVVRALN